jgi:biotin carboxylase
MTPPATGPSPQALELVGDKTRARALAQAAGVPVLAGSEKAGLPQLRAFVQLHGLPVIL